MILWWVHNKLSCCTCRKLRGLRSLVNLLWEPRSMWGGGLRRLPGERDQEVSLKERGGARWLRWRLHEPSATANSSCKSIARGPLRSPIPLTSQMKELKSRRTKWHYMKQLLSWTAGLEGRMFSTELCCPERVKIRGLASQLASRRNPQWSIRKTCRQRMMEIIVSMMRTHPFFIRVLKTLMLGKWILEEGNRK